MDRDESAARRGCQEVGAGLASWERWAGKGPEAAGNSQPSPRRSGCGGHPRPPLKASPCQASSWLSPLPGDQKLRKLGEMSRVKNETPGRGPPW